MLHESFPLLLKVEVIRNDSYGGFRSQLSANLHAALNCRQIVHRTFAGQIKMVKSAVYASDQGFLCSHVVSLNLHELFQFECTEIAVMCMILRLFRLLSLVQLPTILFLTIPDHRCRWRHATNRGT